MNHTCLAAVVACMVVAGACSSVVEEDVSARRTVCARYVAAVAGHAPDDALLDNPEVRALAVQAPDLVMCGAVVHDSDAPCKRLLPEEHGPTTACRYMQSIFHELRTYPQGRSFLFDEL